MSDPNSPIQSPDGAPVAPVAETQASGNPDQPVQAAPRAQRPPVWSMECDLPSLVYEKGEEITDVRGRKVDTSRKPEVVGRWHTNRLRCRFTSETKPMLGKVMHDSSLIIRVARDGQEIIDRDLHHEFAKDLETLGCDPEIVALVRGKDWHRRDKREMDLPLGRHGIAVECAVIGWDLSAKMAMPHKSRQYTVPVDLIMEALVASDLKTQGPFRAHRVNRELAPSKEGGMMPKLDTLVVCVNPKYIYEGDRIVGIDKPGMVILLNDPKFVRRLNQLRFWFEDRISQFIPMMARVLPVEPKEPRHRRDRRDRRPRANEAQGNATQPQAEAPKADAAQPEAAPAAAPAAEPAPAAPTGDAASSPGA